MNRQRELADDARVRASLELFGRAFVTSYAQIFLSQSLAVGGLLLLVTAFAPQLLVGGAAAVALAIVLAAVAGLSVELTKSGLYSYNALLLGIGGVATFAPSPDAIALLAIVVIASVVLTAALHSAMWLTFNLPVLTLPFLLGFTLMLGAGRVLQLEPAQLTVFTFGLGDTLPSFVEQYFRSLGAIFFVPYAEAGVIAFAALCVWSRIGVLLSWLAFAAAYAFAHQLALGGDDAFPLIAGYNFILTAIALGGVWFVPSVSSFALAAVSVAFCGLLAVGLRPYLAWNGIALLILPFNIVVIVTLYAMRQRVRDRAPKAVDFLLGSPESNLTYFRTRLARFGAQYGVRIRAPFLGTWVCTQGIQGELTHRGLWRDAFDFEVRGPDGHLARGEGSRVEDFYCYRLPVVAVADGTVAKVVDRVRDNPVGEVNLHDNWGNVVIVRHGIGLYSMVGHLTPGSVKVREGQVVRTGEQIGLCGNSGRSERPHIHFQLQASDRIGAPTIAAELHDVVRVTDAAEHLEGRMLVSKEDTLRNIDSQRDIAAMFDLRYGEPAAFTVSDGRRERKETVVAEIDLWGRYVVKSRETSALLYCSLEPGMFTVFDSLGPSHSVVRLIHAALGRVPFETGANLTWSDVLAMRHYRPAWLNPMFDFIAPFVPRGGLVVDYRSHRRNGRLVIEGASRQRDDAGAPLVETRAELSANRGIETVSITHRGRTRRALRTDSAERRMPNKEYDT